MTVPQGPTPAVSVIMPARNAGRFIGAAIRSVQAQTFADWELLVIDDASTDETVAIVTALSASDGRLHLLRQESSLGAGAARNRALAAARGQYASFLDSDDLWLPEKLRLQLAHMRREKAVLGHTAFRRMAEDGGQVSRPIAAPAETSYPLLLRDTRIANLTAMVDLQRSGPLRMPEEAAAAGAEDYALWLQLLRRGFVARGLNEDLARYRMTRGSLSRDPLREARRVWHIYRAHERLTPLRASWCLASACTYAIGKRLCYRTTIPAATAE